MVGLPHLRSLEGVMKMATCSKLDPVVDSQNPRKLLFKMVFLMGQMMTNHGIFQGFHRVPVDFQNVEMSSRSIRRF